MTGEQATDTTKLPSSDTYFADPSLTDDEFCKEVFDRVTDYYNKMRQSVEYSRMVRVHRAYYGRSSNSSPARGDRITFGGNQGEVKFIKVNHLRNIAQNILSLATSQRPGAQPIAVNTDEKSYEQTVLAQGLLDYYAREKRVERNFKDACEASILLGEAFVETEWDSTAGAIYTYDEVKNDFGVVTARIPKYEGDLRFTNLGPLDVARDLECESWQETTWVITRKFVNRYDLAARYPAQREKILAIHPAIDDYLRLRHDIRRTRDNYIPVYTFYHAKTNAMPNGGHAILADADCLLYRGELPYDSVPVRRITPSDIIGTTHGYTLLFDLLAIQEAIDALYTAVVTNQITFGIQNILALAGNNLTFRTLATGLNLITYNSPGAEPKALNLTSTPAEIFRFIEQLEGVMETLSSINSVIRGKPQKSLESGSALAVVYSQAIQFNNGLQISYAQLVEDVFTDAINILKKFANTRRVALVVGKFNQYMLKSFSSEDLVSISRVKVDVASPLSKTIQGRLQMAEDLLNKGLIKTVAEYQQVVDTGQIAPLTERTTRQMMLIRKENEALAAGLPTPVLPLDAHGLHIQEHQTIFDDLSMREETPENSAKVNAALQHIEQHVQALRSVDPQLLALIGEQSLLVPPQPDNVQAGGTPAKPSGSPPGQGAAEMPQMPNYPKNPISGQQFNPQDGGLQPPSDTGAPSN